MICLEKVGKSRWGDGRFRTIYGTDSVSDGLVNYGPALFEADSEDFHYGYD